MKIVKEQQSEKDIVQKRILIMLNMKFGIKKSIQPLLLESDDDVKAVYDEFFTSLNNIIQKEAENLLVNVPILNIDDLPTNSHLL